MATVPGPRPIYNIHTYTDVTVILYFTAIMFSIPADRRQVVLMANNRASTAEKDERGRRCHARHGECCQAEHI